MGRLTLIAIGLVTLLTLSMLPVPGVTVSIPEGDVSWELDYETQNDMLDGAYLELRAPGAADCSQAVLHWHYLAFDEANLTFFPRISNPGVCEAKIPADGSPRTVLFWIMLPDNVSADAGGGVPWELEMVDMLEPVISYTPPTDTNLTVGDPDGERIQVRAADSSGSISVVLQYLEPGTAAFGVPPHEIQMEDVGQRFFEARLPGTPDIGEYRYRFRANDTNTARAVTLPAVGWYTFDMIDETAPEIAVLDPPERVGVQDEFTLRFSVLDQGRLTEVSFRLRQTFEVVGTRYTGVVPDAMGIVEVPVPAQMRKGSIDLTITARDAAGNTRISDVYTILVEDRSAPQITDVRANDPWTGGNLELTFNATDEVGIHHVEVIFTQPDNAAEVSVPEHLGGDRYFWRSPELNGNKFTYRIHAVDNNNVDGNFPGALEAAITATPGQVPWGTLAAIGTLLLGLVAVIKFLHMLLPRRGD